MSNGPWGISMKKLGGQMLGCQWTKLLPIGADCYTQTYIGFFANFKIYFLVCSHLWSNVPCSETKEDTGCCYHHPLCCACHIDKWIIDSRHKLLMYKDVLMFGYWILLLYSALIYSHQHTHKVHEAYTMTFKSFCNKSYTFVILIFMFLFSLLVIKDIKFKQAESDSNQKYEENWNVFLANMKSKGEIFNSFFFFLVS